jgi:nucleotide-binding universal stress UspA family protein
MSTTSSTSSSAAIIVGVDGSACSKEALAWAARQARLTGSTLQVVATWTLPTTYGFAPPVSESFDAQSEMQGMLDRTVKEVVGERPPFPLETKVLPGHPATVLTEMSRDASLVIVGSRGHGGFVGLLIGSVSEHLTTHAHCPVVVVRPGTCAVAAT